MRPRESKRADKGKPSILARPGRSQASGRQSKIDPPPHLSGQAVHSQERVWALVVVTPALITHLEDRSITRKGSVDRHCLIKANPMKALLVETNRPVLSSIQMPACLPSLGVGQRGTNMVEIHSLLLWYVALKVGLCLLASEHKEQLVSSESPCQFGPQTGQR